MSDLIQRLREGVTQAEPNAEGMAYAPWTICDPELLTEAANEIERLRAALKPFAESDFEKWVATGDCCIPNEDFYNARAVYEQTRDWGAQQEIERLRNK